MNESAAAAAAESHVRGKEESHVNHLGADEETAAIVVKGPLSL